MPNTDAGELWVVAGREPPWGEPASFWGASVLPTWTTAGH